MSQETDPTRSAIRVRPPTVKEVGDGYREFTGEEVPLWHFPMMNDAVRNDAYDRALGSALRKKRGKVLDIGTGSGLLAMMAARHGASQVITCEALPVIAQKAKKIITQNGFGDKVKVFEGFSTNFQIPRDAPERFDILVTEIFDDGLLGEEAFKAIKHAKAHLLTPEAQIIPARVRVMAMGIESVEIFNNYRVSTAAGFDVREFNEFSLQGYVGIHLDKMKYRAMTAPTPVFSFDFNHLPTGEEHVPLELKITSDGTLHAVAFWFELGMDADTVVSSGPGLPQLSSWKQAVQVAETAESRRQGDTVTLIAKHDESAIWFSKP